MFGTNRKTGQKFFRQMPAESLFVTSVFYTLHAGRPAVFVRLAKCNLACSFCDTAFEQGDILSFDIVDAMIDKAMGRTRGVGLVITGGEPLLQPNLVDYLHRALERHWGAWIQIESNGTIEEPIPDGVTLVVSPKCAEANGTPTCYLTPDDWMLERADALKFVMQAPAGEFAGDSPNPYSSVPTWAHEWRARTGKPVYVSPMNMYQREAAEARIRLHGMTKFDLRRDDGPVSFWDTSLLDMSANERNHRWAAKYCMDHGLWLNLQMHLYAGLA